MNALWQIILQVLWRLRPVSALEMNLHDIIALGFQIFTSDEELDDLAHNPARRATIAPALADAHAKLNLLIYLRACEIAGIKPRSTRFIPNFTCTQSSTDTLALWRAFHRLVAKFDDYERLARRRAQTLHREVNTPTYGSDHRLDATHHADAPVPADPALESAHTLAFAPTRALALARPSATGPPAITFPQPAPNCPESPRFPDRPRLPNRPLVRYLPPTDGNEPSLAKENLGRLSCAHYSQA